MKPDFGDAYLALAYVLSSSGNFAEAITNYKSVIRLNPQSSVAHNNLAVTYLHMGKNKEALAALRRAATLEPNSGTIHLNLARAYLRLRNKDAALAEHTVLKTIDSELAKTLYDEIFQARILKVHD